ncbi:Creatinase/aminopeptidase [Hyphopichia burtonii NRRL Y-1933]|uniref:Creatinase/aminopeptidase n=1 Tax=Hyphopichia burtonii NRRL Y-1933 TaxID=984485 RepID=A0A1E4RKQ3_9ASCO|nr:Creatinase/aminopeptidase [Hyphopichia burtonii NRRL Y-1933]ODV67665.1 Creatinase/aminopeptidase [Hyphopichia burtonii NRRL Y-1933]
MTGYPEKEPLLGSERTRRFAADNEVSTITCTPLFSTLLANPFQCLPQLTKQKSNEDEVLDDSEISYVDDDEQLPDLPYVTSPTVLPESVMDTKTKLLELRRLMKHHGIGVYIIPSEDEHQSEYTALADKRREFISGFTGSAGLCVVTLDDADELTGEAALSTDGRYFLQAQKQLDFRFWRLLKQGVAGFPSWNVFAIEKAISNKFSKVISCDPRLISVSVGEYFERVRRIQYQSKFDFKPLLDLNLVDEVWGLERPTRSLSKVYPLPIKYSGEHTNDKISRIRDVLKSDKIKSTHLVITALDDIAWLFNLRNDEDIPFSPVFFSYAIVTLTNVTLYIHPAKIDHTSSELTEHLNSIVGLSIRNYDLFYNDIQNLKGTIGECVKIVLPSRANASFALVSSIPQSVSKQTIVYNSVVANLKIFKNKTELFNSKIAQFKDSLAFILFASWLDHQLIRKRSKIDEYEAAKKIYSIRAKLPNFKGLSYETISSTGPNAAIIHYAPTKDEKAVIDPEAVYLIDSGAHYFEGTTDITRTYKFGYEGITEELRKFYTLVLKGHLAVAMAKFPPKSASTGTILDAYSRQPLWNEGADFNHGTGHGVGSFGNVHEGPLYILTTAGGAADTDLFKTGAILTDEPGYYADGRFGIRIESELEIVECDDRIGKTRNGENFLGFAYLTKVPFCKKLIDTKYLTQIEVTWVNEYHKSIRNDFGEKLLEMGDRRAYAWLFRETSPIID